MGVFLDAKLKGEGGPKAFETWVGPPGTSRNGKLDFSEFAFDSPLGSFDDDGFFTPNKDLRASAGKELAIKAVYRARLDKFSFDLTFKPDYACIRSAPFGGTKGAAGSSGASGSAGQPGRYGGSSAGGNGGPGGPGGRGGQGADGGDGPKLQVFATFVKTPYYPKLLAIRIRGERDDLLLAPADQPFVIDAVGGPGGDGGQGSSGGPGGSGGAGTPAGDGGNGGSGGDGGNGGKGGHGGDIEIIFDPAYPELANLVQGNAAGGKAGSPGGGGGAGQKGTGGAGTGQNPRSGANGTDGASANRGGEGAVGPAGRVSARSGEAISQVVAPPDITPFAVEKPAEATPSPAPPADPPKGKKRPKK